MQLIAGRAAAAGWGKWGWSRGGLEVEITSFGYFSPLSYGIYIRSQNISQIRFLIRSQKVLLMIGNCDGESGGVVLLVMVLVVLVLVVIVVLLLVVLVLVVLLLIC